MALKRTASVPAGADAKKSTKEKVVLAYSGGLDTSVILVWLVEKVSVESSFLFFLHN